MSTEIQAIQALFNILNKDGVKVPFILSPAQLALDGVDNPTGRARVIIAKARQKGFSRGILAKFAIRCLGKEGTHAVVISHESSATQRLLDSVDYYFKHINGPSPNFGTNSRKEMTFPIRDSVFYIGTAGSRTFGRGDTISDLHCSEYAFWEGTEKLTVGLFQAVPYSGRIYIESTGNGRNNDFYYTWQNAEAMGFTKLFFPWFQDNEYQLNVGSWTPDLPKHNAFLLDLQGRFGLSAQKMAWYEWKLKELRENLGMMMQEYPSEPEECFQATGGVIFSEVDLAYNPKWVSTKWQTYYIHRLQEHPQLEKHYVIGVDPSGGTGNDDAGVQVFCVETGEQVFEFFYNTVNPVKLSELLVELGKEFNDAFIIPEGNNHGAAVVGYLKDNYPKAKIYKRKYATPTSPAIYGWNNSGQTKHSMVGVMLEDLPSIKLYGSQTVKELKQFEEDEQGKLGGVSDNLVISLGLAMLGLRRFEHFRKAWETPTPTKEVKVKNFMTYTLDEVLENISKRKGLIKEYGGQAAANF